VILYKPWRRRIDKQRVRNAHFEPLSQDPNNVQGEGEELGVSSITRHEVGKDVVVDVDAIGASDAAGPARR
jgi:high-affinity nickel-transport protein